MYEDRTEEEIKQDMLNSISNEIDKNERSLTYDAVSAAAIEFAEAYIDLETVASKLDIESLHGDELERFIYQRTGIERKPATRSSTEVSISGQEGAQIRKGDLVASDTVSFVSTEGKVMGHEGQMVVVARCEEPGSIGNVPAGAINHFPVSIPGLTSVTNPEPVTNGYDAESDEELRERYYERIRTPATSGNKYHYLNWAKEVTGVGDANVFPLWNGPGTVKVVIVDANKNPATEDLIANVFQYIEEERPIGATVTVVSAIAKNVEITAKVSLAEGYTIQQVLDKFKTDLDQYRKDVAFKDSYISHAKIGSILLSIDGVLDYTELKLNNAMKNIALGTEEIPIFDTVTLEVI